MLRGNVATTSQTPRRLFADGVRSYEGDDVVGGDPVAEPGGAGKPFADGVRSYEGGDLTEPDAVAEHPPSMKTP